MSEPTRMSRLTLAAGAWLALACMALAQGDTKGSVGAQDLSEAKAKIDAALAAEGGERGPAEDAARAVLRAGEPGIAELAGRIAAVRRAQDSDSARRLSSVLTHLAVQYLDRVEKSGMSFAGQFAALAPLQPAIGRVYLDLLLETPDWFPQGNRARVVAPLRDLLTEPPEHAVMERLRQIAAAEDSETQALREAVGYALAQWGDRGPVDARLGGLADQLASAGDAERRQALLVAMAEIHHRVRDYAKAADAYLEALRSGEREGAQLLPAQYYNAACSLAQAGRGDAALDELERCMALMRSERFDPSQLIEKRMLLEDRDLRPLRGNTRFEELLRAAFPETGRIRKEPGEGK
jgi:tetratricopeptide (TPR) repeat protein